MPWKSFHVLCRLRLRPISRGRCSRFQVYPSSFMLFQGFQVLLANLCLTARLTLSWRRFLLYRNQSIDLLFFDLGFFHKHSRITGLQGKGEGISLTPHYHFHPLHRHLDISPCFANQWTGFMWSGPPSRKSSAAFFFFQILI